MRAFVAIALPEAATEALTQVQARLPVGRIVPRANLHLTLAFLDDQPVQVLEALHEELAELPLAALILDLSGLGCYGGDRPRLVFAQAVPTPALGKLRRQVLGAVRRAGIVLPRRRFHPHVTLARVRANPAAALRLQQFLAVEAGFSVPGFSVSAIALIRSELHPDGAVYHEMARYALT